MSILTPDIIRPFAQEWNSFSGSEEVKQALIVDIFGTSSIGTRN
jgi:hypothetical protein